MANDTTKRVSILVILAFVAILAVGDVTERVDIAYSDGANMGFSTRDIYASNEYVVPDKAMFSLTYTTPKTVNVGEKVYYKFNAFSFKTGPERDLFYKLDSGKPCYVFQKMFNGKTHSLISTGSKHYEFTRKESGATGPYYALDYTLWATLSTPGEAYIRTYYRCGSDQSDVKIDSSSIFTFTNPTPSPTPPDDSDLIDACNLKDTQYCQNGKLIVKDYTYSNEECTYQKTVVENDACFDNYMIEVCSEHGLDYDNNANMCINPPNTPPTPSKNCDGSPEYTTKCVGEVEYQCVLGSWIMTGTDNCVVAITCDGVPQGATKCEGDLEYRCDSGSWVQTGSMACKDVSWFEKYGWIIIFMGVIGFLMLIILGALLFRVRA